MQRRSTARLTPRKRYTTDAFEGIPELDDGSDHSPIRPRHESDSGEDFNDDVVADVEDEEEDEDEMSGIEAGGDPEIASDAASDAGEQELDDDMSIADEEDETTDAPRKRRAPPSSLTTRVTMHNRGLPDYTSRLSGKQTKVNVLFGPTASDWTPVVDASNKWIHEATLPLTRTANKAGEGGCQYSIWQGEEARALEIEQSWNWYYLLGGQEVFSQHQITLTLDAQATSDYVPGSHAPEKALLMGPITCPTLLKLATGQAVSLGEVWDKTRANGPVPVKQPSKGKRAGFVLSLGAKVKCLDWASNQRGGRQYLAVSASPPRVTGEDGTPFGASPAFSPQMPCASSTQIWRFKANSKGSIDTSEEPVLDTVFCTSWGDAKALKWCPAPRQSSATHQNMGLLAGVWGDGGLRVLDVAVSSDDSPPKYLRVDKAAFEAHPPDTVFTCLSWLSSTRIAAGCANGCVAVFDLPKSLSSTNGTKRIRPMIYANLAFGYILSIAGCYPSHPNLFLTTATDGFSRLTTIDTSRPSSFEATIQAPRSRSTFDIVAWHDFSQAAVIVDDSFLVKGITVRRFFTTMSLGRGKSAATALATSPCHPSILVGTAEGEVMGSNPMRRMVETKYFGAQQVWFAHEWRRATPAEAGRSSPGPDEIGANGVSRFTEGYKVVLAQRNYLDETTKAKVERHQHGVYAQTIYEEETGVTALAWNPNKECGTWAAAGLADGLLRVEDFVVD